MFCLNKNIVNDFLAKLKSGEINPDKLSEMTSAERREFFSKFMGEANAEKTNSLFESKLLLKHQQQGMIRWAQEVAGLKPEVSRDIVSRVNKMTEVLNPANEKAFLEDLAAHKLGVSVTMEEAASISSMAKAAADAKAKIPASAPIRSPERMDYGYKITDFGEYVSNLKNEARKLTLEDLKANPVGATVKAGSKLAGISKSLKAAYDNSVLLRQGLKSAFTNPGLWRKNAAKTYVDMWNVFGGKNVMREINADIMSRPNALNGLYAKEKLAVGVVEEAYPESLPEKIPGVRRLYKASETAFSGFQKRMRADVFDKYVDIAEKSGADIQGIGRVVNSLTGRGTFGQKMEAGADVLNNVFFSPRYLKSNIDILTWQISDYGSMGNFARVQAATNTVKVISGVAAILALANAVMPGSVETDPTSADFGKIRIKDTRFEISGGLSSIVILAARYILGRTKSSVTGKVTQLNSGEFGSKTRTDIVFDFFENKLSPVASVLKQINDGRDRDNNKMGWDLPTAGRIANSLVTPLPITSYLQLKNNPNSADILLSMLLDLHGVSSNTYSKKAKKVKLGTS